MAREVGVTPVNSPGVPVLSMSLWQLGLTLTPTLSTTDGMGSRCLLAETGIRELLFLVLRFLNWRNKKPAFRGGETEQSWERKRQIQVKASQPQISVCPQCCPMIPPHIPGIFTFPFPTRTSPLFKLQPPLPARLLIWVLNCILYCLLTTSISQLCPHSWITHKTIC